jgi:predicted  nucleic acid-binding Zn-ribbon protein
MAILPLLYRIQEIESSLTALERNLADLQQNSNLKAVRLLHDETKSSIERIETDLKEVNKKQRQLELELKTCQERLKNEENKLYGGANAHARELEQIQQKVGEYLNHRTQIEDELLHMMEQDEECDTQLGELNVRLEKVLEEEDRIEAELRQQSLEVDFEKEQLRMELEELVRQVPPEWLERYRKIAKAHRGIGIAKLKQNSCGACHVRLSESRLNQVKRGEDKLQYCENCGRILFY